jgi:regulator of replication initiation timing
MNEHVTEKNPLKKWVILLAILAIVFFGTTLYFGFFAKPVFNQEFIKTVVENEYLQSELDSLLTEHERIKLEYGDLSEQLSEKDSIIIANANEIKKLIDSQANYRRIRRQLERLQNIAKEYVEEIDQLFTENKQLKEENTQVRAQLTESKKEIEAIKKDRQELNQTLSTAAVHQAYNINSRAVYFKNRNKEEVVTEKTNRVDQFKTTFILGANSLIPAGPVTVYARIAIPGSGRILSPGAGDAFSFMYGGEKLQYTAKQTVNYDNKAEVVTIVWDIRDNDKAEKGRYVVQLFTDNQFLGESSFELK